MNPARLARCLAELAGALLLVLLSACATPQVSRLQSDAGDLPATGSVSGVPFFAQKEYECGPAAQAMVLSAAGVAVTPDELVQQVYLPARKGSLQVEMLAATRQRGLLAYRLQPNLKDLLAEVAAGHPVLVFQNVSLPIYPVWHYAVVIGYDLKRNTITLHSGETASMEMSLFAFERTWERGNYWSMLALPAGLLPATADLPSLARSAADLEAQQPQVALATYNAALARWPGDANLLLGQGNSEYALGQIPVAIQAYRAAVQARPDFADAWNNLAQAQLDAGNRVAAAQAIAEAVKLGGARLAQYQALQTQIQSATPQ
ncbi:PA2778 family cysteine peptidase [Rhodoferax sp. GW822-FHT02A01]|uniref:PA2778 family cysteine peptidase n=1 Tax=Rhodoferax sp. GW822-FHT02A01 TaxID=3141537 RepID=UPI00315D812D